MGYALFPFREDHLEDFVVNTTWIVIADGAQACSYQYQGPYQPLSVVEGSQLRHVNEPTRNLVSSRPGRAHGYGSSSPRSAVEPSTDAHRHQKAVFARELGNFLEQHINEFDDLIIAAPAKVLGDIRHLAPRRVLQKVRHELDKELTKIPPQELPKYFDSVLNIAGSLSPRIPI
jgi:protein required for attachment to host cells